MWFKRQFEKLVYIIENIFCYKYSESWICLRIKYYIKRIRHVFTKTNSFNRRHASFVSECSLIDNYPFDFKKTTFIEHDMIIMINTTLKAYR